jgi:regulator of cell morphogenesis and NO signaling
VSAALDWSEAPLVELVRHVLDHHHVYTKDALARLDAMAKKLVREEGGARPELRAIAAAVAAMADELTSHMMKEERILFPYMTELGEGRRPFAPFGTVKNPVAMMLMEHDQTQEELSEIRAATDGFTAPKTASAAHRELYAGLRALEKDLVEHMRLESEVLFPRAIELEARGA